MNKRRFPPRLFLLPTALIYLSGTAFAQESAYADLDACVQGELVSMAAKGAGVGALTGLAAGLFSNKKENAVKGAAIGAVVGGAAGFATARYTANQTCRDKNPAWIPESQIVRTKDYQLVRKEAKYKDSEGIKVEAKGIEMATSAKAGTMLDLRSTFIVLTPDGAETPISIERKLFLIDGGKESVVPFTGRNKEERTVAPGRYDDPVKIEIARELKTGDALRVEFTVAADNKPPSTVSRTVTVI